MVMALAHVQEHCSHSVLLCRFGFSVGMCVA